MREKKVIEEFNKRGINYCILRNYEKSNFDGEEDIDILIHKRDGVRVKKILKENGFLKKIGSWGPYLIGDKKFDIKVGCLDYGGFCIKDASKIFPEKRKYDYFYILGKNDELIHLILKSLSLNSSSIKYRDRIKKLLKETNAKDIERELVTIFGSEGKIVLKLIKKGKYNEAAKSKEKLIKNIRSIKNRGTYLFYRLMFPCFKR